MPEVELVDGVVNKPQFDTDKFKPGTAVKVSCNKLKLQRSDTYYGETKYNLDHNALVKQVTPLKLDLVYVADNSADITEVVAIEIKDVVKGFIDIEIIK